MAYMSQCRPTSRVCRAPVDVVGMNTASSVRRAPFPVRGNHKQCMKCGKLVSRAAFACRRCGKRQRIRPRTMLLVLSGCLLVGDVRDRERERAAARRRIRPRSAPAWPKMAAAPAIPKAASQVTASELWAAYARDAAEADRQFRDKAVDGERNRAVGGARPRGQHGRAALDGRRVRDRQREARDAQRSRRWSA